MDIVRVDAVYKSFYGSFRLGPIDLNIASGEILGVMGPNGAGKTTLLRLLWGFIRPDAGRISVFGMTPHLQQVDVRLKAGYLSENLSFYNALTAHDFLKLVSNFYNKWDTPYADGLLDELQIKPDAPIYSLSKGARVKLGLVSALGHRPSLVILDAPTDGLDPAPRTQILNFLSKLARDSGTSILLSSHISDDLERTVDSVLMLKDGRVVEYARAAHLFEKYSMSRLEEIFLNAIVAQPLGVGFNPASGRQGKR